MPDRDGIGDPQALPCRALTVLLFIRGPMEPLLPADVSVVLLLCCLLSVEGRPSRNFALAKDERTVNTAEGKHTLDFEVVNHQKRKEIGKQDDGQSFSGSFDFVTGDGEAFEIMYVADGRGFLPQGEHLPVAPALPYHRVQPFPRSHK
ncbi:cuticle protein AM1159-like [Oratosquilla oratoria]|uniref:cuticle protein AM1159-like n=1 Tax=Oratosquilla oratoria TaxID=337810 RepID=UPI003F774736